MNTQLLQDHLRIPSEHFQFLVGMVGMRELYQFNFLKLMLPDDAAHIFTVRSRLAAKTWRVGGERDREPRGVQHFIAVKIRYWDFGGWNQPQVLLSVWNSE